MFIERAPPALIASTSDQNNETLEDPPSELTWAISAAQRIHSYQFHPRSSSSK
jgi:hypothetical protein